MRCLGLTLCMGGRNDSPELHLQPTVIFNFQILTKEFMNAQSRTETLDTSVQIMLESFLYDLDFMDCSENTVSLSEDACRHVL